MKRKIIEIDEAKCNGCGQCITACAEGALKMIDGKARLVSDKYCDGLGDCLGECPTGALQIVERDAPEFDEQAVQAHQAGGEKTAPAPAGTAMPQVNRSELQQWPVQLHLVQPGAPFFQNRELVIMSTCAPVASADMHGRFLRGRAVVMACPKLDRTEGYVEKLAAILRNPSIPRVYVVRMTVPCCGGLTMMARAAAAQSGHSDLDVREVIVDLNGAIREAI